MTLFDGDTSPAFNAGLVEEMTALYTLRLLTNPPTPAFMETNPRREGAAKFAAQRDVSQFLAVLDDMGLTITHKEKS